jgi:hypothetical protein
MFRETVIQVSPVAMSCPSLGTTVPPCLPLGIKDPLKEDGGFCLRLLLVAFSFSSGAFWCGKVLEGKRIAEGKNIAEGKRTAKKGLIESLY